MEQEEPRIEDKLNQLMSFCNYVQSEMNKYKGQIGFLQGESIELKRKATDLQYRVDTLVRENDALKFRVARMEPYIQHQIDLDTAREIINKS